MKRLFLILHRNPLALARGMNGIVHFLFRRKPRALARGASLVCVIGIMFSLSFNANAQSLQPQASPLKVEKSYRVMPQEDSRPALFSSSFLDSPGKTSVYKDNPTDKGSYGVINTITSWVNVPKAVTKTTEEHNAFVGATVGLGEGIIKSVGQAILGVADIATFGLPPYDEPLLKPEYKVEDPDKGLQINILKW